MSRRCTTHFHACDCREAKFAALNAENAMLRGRLETISITQASKRKIQSMAREALKEAGDE